MASAAENTKIELITEAFEQLAISIAQGMILAERISPNYNSTPELVAVQRADAREQVAEALRALLKPTLRIAEDQGRLASIA